MAQTRRSGARSEVKRLADLVQEAVDEGATSAEEIHKSIADLPLEVLERLDVFKDAVEDVRKVQDASIGAVYDAIRQINREVTALARRLVKPAPRRRPASRKAKAVRSHRTARSVAAHA